MNHVAEHGAAPRALPEWTRPRRVSVTGFAAALTATLFAVTAPAEEHLLRGGNGPGPAANGPGPGCNLIPPLASTGTKVDISQFPPPDSLTDPELAGPVQLLRSGKFDLPIEQLTGVNVPAGTPRGTITLPLFKGAVDRKSTPLNSSHVEISYAVFCLKKKKKFNAVIFLTHIRPSLVMFLVLWLQLVKVLFQVRWSLARVPCFISFLFWLDLVASLALIKGRIVVIILM